MSRSRRKNNILSSNVSKKDNKISKKKIRRTDDISNGNSYKKVYETWKIRDYKIISEEKETLRK